MNRSAGSNVVDLIADAARVISEDADVRSVAELWEVLTGADKSTAFEHLTTADRTAILEILGDTKPDFVAMRPKP